MDPTEVLDVYTGDSLEQAMAVAVAALGTDLQVRRARKVRSGVRGLMGREVYEVLAAPGPSRAGRRPDGHEADAVGSALDRLLAGADADDSAPALPAGQPGRRLGRRRSTDAAPPVVREAGLRPQERAPAQDGRDGAAAPRAAAAPAAPPPVTPAAVVPGAGTASGAAVGRSVPAGGAAAPADAAPATGASATQAATAEAAPSTEVAATTRTAGAAATRRAVPKAGTAPTRRAVPTTGTAPTRAPSSAPSAEGASTGRGTAPARPAAATPAPPGGSTRAAAASSAPGGTSPAAAASSAPAGSSPRAASAAPTGRAPGTAARTVPAGPLRRRTAAPSRPGPLEGEVLPPLPADPVAPRSPAVRSRPGARTTPTRHPDPAVAEHTGPASSPAPGPGWDRRALRRLGVPAAVLGALPQEDPTDDLGWLNAVTAAIGSTVPAPAVVGPEHPVVVDGYGLEGAVAILQNGVKGATPGTLVLDGRAAPASAVELALVLRAHLTGR